VTFMRATAQGGAGSYATHAPPGIEVLTAGAKSSSDGLRQLQRALRAPFV